MQGSRLLLALTLALLLLPLGQFGQTDRGTIVGIVTDASGAVVPGASVTATRAGTNTTFHTTSTPTGNFTIPALHPGEYSLTIEAPGFKTYRQTNLIVIAGGTTRADAALEIGAVTESVNVVSTVAQLQTATAEVVAQVSTQMIDQLPLVVGGAMRSPFDLALITPEANQHGADLTFQIGGAQGGSYGATMDGITILTGRFNSVEWASVNTPSIDAIQEFTVESSGMKAEFGRGSGGTMSFSTKSGTNQFHGTAYEFLRNNALDARRFFEAQRGIYKQHDFGWSAGGPVYLPRLYDGRNRTFFFTAMEWFRNREGATSSVSSVPTPEMYRGDFTKWVNARDQLIPIYDPDTTRPNPAGAGFIRDPFPGNFVPQSRFAEFTKAVLKVIGEGPAPNTGAAPGTSAYVRNNFINNKGSTVNPWNKYSVRIDHQFSDAARVAFLYHRGEHLGPGPGPDGLPGLPVPFNTGRVGKQISPVYRASYTHTISPTMVNSLYAGGHDWKEWNLGQNVGTDWRQKGICLKGAWDCSLNFPMFTFDDFSSWGGIAGDGSENTAYSIGNDLSIVRGAHTFKMGYLWERLHYNGWGRANIAGVVDFRRLNTSVPGNNDINTGGGNAFASFLLGHAWGGATENDRYLGQQWRSHGWYFQDDWQITRRLVMNLGVRYEFTLPPLEKDDKWSDFTPDRPNPGATRPDGTKLLGALRFAGFGPGRENSRTLVPGYFRGIAPRLGFAYQLDDNTVLRMAGGVYNGVVKTSSGSAHFEGATIRFFTSSTNNGLTPTFHVDQGLPEFRRPPFIEPEFANGGDMSWWDNEAVRLPRNYQYTLSMQRKLGESWVIEAAYNGNIGTHLMALVKNPNQQPWDLMEKYGRDVLQARLDSSIARNAGITPPYVEIYKDFGANVGVAQALRPYPQYRRLDTWRGQGDKSGHSTYHALVLKADKRFSSGFTFQGSYTLSKILTDAANFFDYDNLTQDHYNRRIEKSISPLDRTHNIKMSYIYELPFGKGRRWLTGGVASVLAGGWRISGIQIYTSGAPLMLVNANTFPIDAFRMNALYMDQVGTYEGWVVKHEKPNWRGGDRYFQPASFFGQQSALVLGRTRPGDATRFNPKARNQWNLVENFSIARVFRVTEAMRLDFRFEAFNAFNRSRFDTGSTNVTSPTFGVVTTTINQPRRAQLALKLYW
jgi:hypothetical protein